MKRKLLILLAVLLCSCSAERRLAHLLRQHPELRTETASVVVPVEVQLPGDSASIIIPAKEAYAFLDTSYRANVAKAEESSSYTVKAGRAQAVLQRSDSGIVLTAIQLPDTISVDAAAEVPLVEVHDLPMEENSLQTFFRVLGYISGAIITLGLILFTLKKFIL